MTKAPFERLTYDEAIKYLQEEGQNIQWGTELTWDLERILSLTREKPFFITNYPASVENQFFKENPKNPTLSLVTDLMAPEGYGEIGGGGETGNKEDLLKKMQQDEVDLDIQRWYSELKNSNPTNSGFAIGIERYLQWLCGLKSISQTTLFPRTFNSVSLI
jgi:asparaginyl-tRNA synthetase